MDLSNIPTADLERALSRKVQPTTDLSGFSTDELLKALERSDPGATAKGLGKALGVGLGEAAIGLAGAPADISGALHKGSNLLAGQITGQPVQSAPSLVDTLGSENIRKTVEGATGKFYKPQTVPEEYFQTFGQFAPAAAFPGSVPMRAAQWALPALTSEAAGQRTKGTPAEPWARAGAALVTGGLTSLAGRPATATRAIAGQMPDYVTPAHVQQAEALIGVAGQRGITLTWPEALSKVTGRPVLTDMQRILESAPQSRAFMQQEFGGRPAAIEGEARRQFDALGPQSADPSRIGPAAGREAEGIIRGEEKFRTAATSPYYKAAATDQVPQSVMGRFVGEIDQAIAADKTGIIGGRLQELRSFLTDPKTGNLITDIENLDRVRKFIRDKVGQPQIGAEAITKEQGAALMQRLDTLRTEMVAASPSFAAGKQLHQDLTKQFLDPLMEGPIGKLAQKDITTQNAIKVLFPDSPLAGGEKEIGEAVREMARRSPTLATQMVRQHAEMTFNKSVKAARGQDFTGARFAKNLVGDPQDMANLQAAITNLPGGAGRWAGFEKFMEIAAATGERQPIGSKTAFNAQELKQMSSGGAVEGAVKTGLSPGKWLTVVAEKWSEWQLGRNLDGLSKVLTDPNSARMLEALAKFSANDPRAAILASRLALQADASQPPK